MFISPDVSKGRYSRSRAGDIFVVLLGSEKDFSYMAKKKKKSIKDIEAMAVPSADNAKWMGIGFIAAVVMVGIGMAILVQVR